MSLCPHCGQEYPPSDDDEPVTEEWLQSIEPALDRIAELGITVSCHLDTNGGDLVSICGGRVKYNRRGQVRRLCTAFGITLG